MFTKLSSRLVIYLAIFTSIILVVFLELKSIEAQTPPPTPIATDERDAIAVRVLPNPNNYSVTRWYNSQGFSGSPQSLVVDGYEAVRDGRTVYVNAANISGNNLYTNIYLISYSQDPDTKTVDILGRIIKHWKFNSNLTQTGRCSIATKYCESDSDCDKGTTCQEIGGSLSMCKDFNQLNCLIDAECPSGLFCDSIKAKVTRDVKRLGILSDTRAALDRYQAANGAYPILGAGTYISHNSVSTWPSWRNILLSQLSLSPNLVDPINVLGPCPNYDLTTCWNEETGSFADPIPNNNKLNMPGGSYAIAYVGDVNGSNYSLCSVLESHMLGYNTPEGSMSSQTCVTGGTGYTGLVTDNQPPQLISYYLGGETGQEFNGFFRVIDPENNPLVWSLNTSSANWSSWSAVPILQDTGNPNQKRVYAARAGAAGNYPLTLQVSDSLGASLSTTVPIIIGNPAPFIEMTDIDYYLNPKKPLLFSFKITDNNLSTNPASVYTFFSTPNSIVSNTNSLKTHNYLGNTLSVNVSRLMPTTLKFYKDTVIGAKIIANDTLGASSSKDFKINLKITPPRLDFVCPRQIRAGTEYQYFCLIGSDGQGDFTIQYSSNTLPNNIVLYKLLQNEQLIDYYNYDPSRPFVPNISGSYVSDWILTGKGAVEGVGAHDITIKATNNYGASTTRQFILNINNYCGDGIKQTPNTEGRGGFYNDGNEDCDGSDGVTTSPLDSSISKQYACSTPVNAEEVFPILTGDHCIFKSPIQGGGYCGDGVCQASQAIGEDSDNCPQDCGYPPPPIPACGNEILDSDEACEIINGQVYPALNCADVPGANFQAGAVSCSGCKYDYRTCLCQPDRYDCNRLVLGCESSSPCPVCLTCSDRAALANVNNGFNCGRYLSNGCGGYIDCLYNCGPGSVCGVGSSNDIDCQTGNLHLCDSGEQVGFCRQDTGCNSVIDVSGMSKYGRMACISSGPYSSATGACGAPQSVGDGVIYQRSSICQVGTESQPLYSCASYVSGQTDFPGDPAYFAITDGTYFSKSYAFFNNPGFDFDPCASGSPPPPGLSCYDTCIANDGEEASCILSCCYDACLDGGNSQTDCDIQCLDAGF